MTNVYSTSDVRQPWTSNCIDMWIYQDRGFTRTQRAATGHGRTLVTKSELLPVLPVKF
ncbi:hypothetical protein DPMN_075056 [Dreissena polymorpha]|uniref:Uncharacterized protein n=1 Tax=Dreissena polymorpha TaxID=45954 RepID=A0A9D3YJQ8_DREPO|nr:hypothetical protein DPMN_075056 [Dreissena polymorpha]